MHYACSVNELISLEGSPKKINGEFICANNSLTSLMGGPEWVDKTFNCQDNDLKTLKGGPNYVAGDYICSNNDLVDLQGFPEYFDTEQKHAEFQGNPVYDIYRLMPVPKAIELINEEMPINVETKEVSHTILSEIWDQLDQTGYSFDYLEPKLTSYKLVE